MFKSQHLNSERQLSYVIYSPYWGIVVLLITRGFQETGCPRTLEINLLP